jgi:hypothetical protein
MIKTWGNVCCWKWRTATEFPHHLIVLGWLTSSVLGFCFYCYALFLSFFYDHLWTAPWRYLLLTAMKLSRITSHC